MKYRYHQQISIVNSFHDTIKITPLTSLIEWGHSCIGYGVKQNRLLLAKLEIERNWRKAGEMVGGNT